MFRVVGALLGLMTVAPVMAQNMSAPEALPPLVLHFQSQIREECGGAVKFAEEFIRTANFTPDGKPDFILNYGAIECSGQRVHYCGSGGCSHMFVVSVGQTYRSEEMLLRDYEIIPTRTGDVIRIRTHGVICGRPGVEDCESIMFWSRDKFTSRG